MAEKRFGKEAGSGRIREEGKMGELAWTSIPFSVYRVFDSMPPKFTVVPGGKTPIGVRLVGALGILVVPATFGQPRVGEVY